MTDPSQRQQRREFLKQSLAGAGAALSGFVGTAAMNPLQAALFHATEAAVPSMLGGYGDWAVNIVGDGPARLSLLQPQFHDVETWRKSAQQRVLDCLATPPASPMTDVRIDELLELDGLEIERVSWQLSYGPRTNAVVLKPKGATGKLPAVLGLHDHGGNKYFGHEKITRTAADLHPLLVKAQAQYYGGAAWANELAQRGYVVLVHDTFAFGSRRVRMEEVSPPALQGASLPEEDASEESIAAYNRWAAGHEHLLAKSLLCAGTTWPGVFLSEDRHALDYLCGRSDVDPERIGCAGLSGGGLRTVYLGGLDERIRCACCVGMMTTWRDYLLHKCHTHTWMIYIPLIARDLDYPEILGLRAPAATLVLNDEDDQLFTLPEMQRADGMLRSIFNKAGAADRYRCSFYPGPHKFDVPMQAEAFDWFDRWLKS